MAVPQIDFYTLTEPDRRARLVTACRLAEKACEQGLRVSVRTGGPAETAEFDELLWTFSDRSFVPHVVWPSEPEIAAATPVLVGSAGFPDHHRQVLINLASDAPADFSAYARVCELVGGGEDDKKAGRNRWRTYREAGCLPEAHPL